MMGGTGSQNSVTRQSVGTFSLLESVGKGGKDNLKMKGGITVVYGCNGVCGACASFAICLTRREGKKRKHHIKPRPRVTRERTSWGNTSPRGRQMVLSRGAQVMFRLTRRQGEGKG